ncbi:MAG: UDP-N-acetylglucosamine--LPS N-acetylglucosamine transferase [Acidobacteria bacterium]|nr:UDP-N-acetylglucosamine--LPS N-acetylglucosamine transferase [Acidobacteriota bacterium]MBS1866108.1 UDP-N-acetylglucosamine--LPS N-acetylglucosamine transferase [Acidobacteriota bacterium]
MNKKPRVLLLSASSGAGHVRAAQALEKAFAARGDCIVEHVDVIHHVSKVFQRLYDKTYIGMIRRAPELMGLLYKRTDNPWEKMRTRLAVDRLNTQPMIRMLKRVQPDLCIATHFLPGEIIAWLKAKKKLRAHNAVVVTDYDVHAMWLCRTVDRYYVAIPEAAEYLAGIGVPREILRITGIPVDPLFSVPLEQSTARKQLGLDKNAPVILIAAGGYGIGPVEQLVRDLLALQKPWQIVAIAGKSEQVKKKLDDISARAGNLLSGSPRLVPVGFTKEMDQYMAAADLLVGKAGGLTTSEALSRALPMALIEPIPGQEERNADHLLEEGAAIRCNNLPAAAWKIAGLMDDTLRLARMKEAARNLGRPNAAANIAADALKLLS